MVTKLLFIKPTANKPDNVNSVTHNSKLIDSFQSRPLVFKINFKSTLKRADRVIDPLLEENE